MVTLAALGIIQYSASGYMTGSTPKAQLAVVGSRISLEAISTALNHFTIFSFLDRLAPALQTIFHQCVISYTCSQSNSDGSVKTEPSELDWLKVYDMTHLMKYCFKDWSQSTFRRKTGLHIKTS